MSSFRAITAFYGFWRLLASSQACLSQVIRSSPEFEGGTCISVGDPSDQNNSINLIVCLGADNRVNTLVDDDVSQAQGGV